MIVEIKVPQLPESVSEATLMSWNKKVGEFVARDENLIDLETDKVVFVVRDENLIDLETDKVVLELPTAEAGVLTEIIEQDGATVVSGQVIAKLDTNQKSANILINGKGLKMEINKLKMVDYTRCRLPMLSPNQFTDPGQGLWEFHGESAEKLKELNIRSRDPALDIRTESISIDFGTSSTVVAVEDGGRAQLLRIGVQDFWRAPQLGDYENPTVLEFLDLKATLDKWQKEAYQPNINWNEVRCSHEAQSDLRNNATEPHKVAAILNKIKQWALRESEQDERVIITDLEHGDDYPLSHLTLRNPVKNEKLRVSSQDPFDPVELYAYFLGLYINWRRRGIYLKYFLTFPVAYPRESKEKILSSFRRGLQRSLPETLVNAKKEFADYQVNELACEPLAYAAATFHYHDVQPTDDGAGYAIFDFGGGTADFAYGLYRLPNQKEEDKGFEEVIEHLSVEGDRFLGGENLLENIVYKVFLHNVNICRKHKISFSRPMDAEYQTGLEMLIQSSREARTNTLVLMTQMRKFWESGYRIDGSVLTVALINHSGEKVLCELSLPYDNLSEYLHNRIEQGIRQFFTGMKKAFKNKKPQELHILLAGNASRSKIVLDFFEPLMNKKDSQKNVKNKSGKTTEPPLTQVETNQDESNQATETPLIFQIVAENFHDEHVMEQLEDSKLTEKVLGVIRDTAPKIIIHQPLSANVEKSYIPTAKTGVALGLLKLKPGSPIKIIDCVRDDKNKEAPFPFYVGAIIRRCFKPGLMAGSEYGTWKEIGKARENTFRLVYTTAPSAYNGQLDETDDQLEFINNIKLSNAKEAVSVFVKALAPNKIALCTAKSLDDINSHGAQKKYTRN